MNAKVKETHQELPQEDTGDENVHSWVMDWLYDEASLRDISITELARYLGVSRAYLFTLRNDPKRTRRLSLDMVEKIATFLGKSQFVVMKACGILRPEDFFAIDSAKVDEECNRCLKFMQSDSDWADMVPPDFKNMPLRTKTSLVRAYEKCTGHVILINDYPTLPQE